MYTMKDFERDYVIKHLMRLPPQEQVEVLKEALASLKGLSPKKLLESFSVEQLRECIEERTAN